MGAALVTRAGRSLPSPFLAKPCTAAHPPQHQEGMLLNTSRQQPSPWCRVLGGWWAAWPRLPPTNTTRMMMMMMLGAVTCSTYQPRKHRAPSHRDRENVGNKGDNYTWMCGERGWVVMVTRERTLSPETRQLVGYE